MLKALLAIERIRLDPTPNPTGVEEVQSKRGKGSSKGVGQRSPVNQWLVLLAQIMLLPVPFQDAKVVDDEPHVVDWDGDADLLEESLCRARLLIAGGPVNVPLGRRPGGEEVPKTSHHVDDARGEEEAVIEQLPLLLILGDLEDDPRRAHHAEEARDVRADALGDDP